MVIDSRKQLLKKVRQKKYLNKDFDGFRLDLLEYARLYFGDKIRDFSETSLGGLFVELSSYIGDVQSFYLDHQFHELSPETAVETNNVQRLLRDAGMEIMGASPAVVNCAFSVQIPADMTVSPRVPLNTALPVIQAGSVVQAQSGIQFTLTEDLDFTKTDSSGNLIASIAIGTVDAGNLPTSFILSLTELCISGFMVTETFAVGSFKAFNKITLSNANVTDILTVTDGFGNNYYKVQYLTQDTVFQSTINQNNDNDLVKENLSMSPAPYRYIAQTDIQTRLTTLTFGGGTADSLDNNAIPDPSDFAVPLYGKKTFSRFTLDPGSLLKTTTLGVSAANTTISITYRYGGGLSHNISAGSIRGVTTLNMIFPNGATSAVSQAVRASVDAINSQDAGGGSEAPTLDDLKLLIPSIKASQSRIVTKEDLLARVYTMPSNFGRVFRANIRSNPNNPLSTQLFIISRNKSNQLTISPDSLKKNLVTYLNSYRIISDAYDILDAQVINVGINLSILIDPTYTNKNLILQNVISRLKAYFDVKNFDIDQPIVLSDIHNIAFNNQGVINVQNIKVINLTGTVGNRTYSDVQFDVVTNTVKGLIVPPPGGLFEVRFKDFDLNITPLG